MNIQYSSNVSELQTPVAFAWTSIPIRWFLQAQLPGRLLPNFVCSSLLRRLCYSCGKGLTRQEWMEVQAIVSQLDPNLYSTEIIKRPNVAYFEDNVFLNQLQTRPVLGIWYEDWLQQLPLGWIDPRAIFSFALNYIIVDFFGRSCIKWCWSIMVNARKRTYPESISTIKTPNDQISAWKLAPIPFITSGAM